MKLLAGHNRTLEYGHLLFDGLYAFKSLTYYRRYFATIHSISQSGSTPFSLWAAKLSLIYKIGTYLLLYTLTLPETVHILLFDYFHLTEVTVEFNLIMAALFLSIYLLLNQMYFAATGSDYTQLIYQVILKQNTAYFLQLTIHKKSIFSYLTKILLKMSNIIIFCFLTAGLFFILK